MFYLCQSQFVKTRWRVVVDLLTFIKHFSNLYMKKAIKSGVRKILFRMISKFEEKQQEKEAQFNQKHDCLRVVLDFLENLENVAGVDDIVKTIEKLTDLEQNSVTLALYLFK